MFKHKETYEINLKHYEEKLHEITKELSEMKDINDQLVQKVQFCKERSQKYKDKFRFSVDLVKKMNQMLEYFYKKKITANKQCQTDYIEKLEYYISLNATKHKLIVYFSGPEIQILKK